MIAIAIIGVLTASLFPMISGYMYKAKLTAMKADTRQVQTALQVLMAEQGKVLKDITGDVCTECYCRKDGFGSSTTVTTRRTIGYDGDVRFVQAGHLCYEKTVEMWQKLRDMTSFTWAIPFRDPWGGMYLLDENFYEHSANPCREDMIISGGPDNKRDNIGDIVTPLEFPTTCQ